MVNNAIARTTWPYRWVMSLRHRNGIIMRHRHSERQPVRRVGGGAAHSVLSAPALAQSVTRITLNGSGATSSGGNVSISGSAVTITGPGTYEITGTLNNGYVRVDSPADGLVSLILNNASITNSTNSPLQIEDADEAEIVLAPGSTNQLTDGSNYVFPDPNEDEPNATLVQPGRPDDQRDRLAEHPRQLQRRHQRQR